MKHLGINTIRFAHRLIFTGLCSGLCVGLLGALLTQPAHADTRAVVVAGLGGNVEYNAAFSEQADTIVTALESITSSPEHVTLLIGADSNRAEILAHLQSLADEINAAAGGEDAIDTLVLIMIGHGNMNRDGWQFNVAGPDLSVVDLIGALAPINVAQEVIVASASASGGLLKSMSQPGRTLVTATKNGGETNAVRFTEYFAEALGSDSADLDRNELLTVREAFTFANDATQRYFEDQKLLASEHARLDGDDAVTVTLATLGALRDAKSNPVIAALLDERSVLEASFYAVRSRKSELASDTYYSELETVLIDIATLQRRIDAELANATSGESVE